MSEDPIKHIPVGLDEAEEAGSATVGYDPTEAARRELLPKINRPAVRALQAATTTITEAAGGPDVEVTKEQAEVLRKQRDDEAERLLHEHLVAEHGKDNVFNTKQLHDHFNVIGFAAPYVVVVRLSDRQKGSLTFTHWPRRYFDFRPHTP